MSIMMTSTFPTSRSHNSLNGLKEIQSKKEALVSLENALKKRINEFKELCLKEGELTGHLPIDYPLQPREPIPQIRRRVNQKNGSGSISASSSNNNLNDLNNIALPCSSSIKSSNHLKLESAQPRVTFAIPSDNLAPTNCNFPSRPTSTNSTSSSISTASSNTRNAHHAILSSQTLSSNPSNRNSSSTTTTQVVNNNNNAGHCFTSNHTNYNDQAHNLLNHRNHRPIRYDQSMMPTHFKRPLNMQAPQLAYDIDTMSHMRASSTASSSSSSGSGTSSVLSAPPAVTNSSHVSEGLGVNLHGRSYSESINNDSITQSSKFHMRPRSQDMLQRQHFFNQQMSSNAADLVVPPARPPRGPHESRNRQICTDTTNGNIFNRQPSENRTSMANTHQQQKDASSTGKPLQHFNMNGLTANFQPFLEEETKPFQMSDFYKYSSKYRQKVSDPQKTTRQLQEDVLKKNSLKYSSCDDQLQALPKLFEKSGQKLIEATAKAIAGNPGLAEKLNNILPNNRSDRF